MNEERIRQLFQQDLSIGTETFRDALLDRCLESLHNDGSPAEVSDDVLDLLAAAGDPFAQPPSDDGRK